MDKLSSLFTAIGDLFTGSSWFRYVQWPFWTFLFLLAIGGIYTVRFKRNTVFCQGVQGVLKLTLIYMTFVLSFVLIPDQMKDAVHPPFLSVTGETLTLINPLELLGNWKDTLPEYFVRLYFLLLMINAVGSLDYMGKNPVFWFILQIVSCVTAVIFFKLAAFLITTFWQFKDAWLYNSMAVVILSVTVVMVSLKLFFLVTMQTGNHAYTVCHQFLSTHRIGSLFSSSIISTALVMVFLVLVDLFDNNHMSLARFDATAFALIGFMCMMTLAVYNTLYTERKPA